MGTNEAEVVDEIRKIGGIIVSTGLGSTGWLKSILAGAASIVNGISDA